MRRFWPILGGLTLIVMAAAAWLLPEIARESEVRQNALSVFAAAEEYSVGHYFEEYPFQPQQLIDEHYLDRIPTNPYTGHAMAQVPPGRGQPGDFTYFTVPEEILPGYIIGTRSIYIAYGTWNPMRSKQGFGVFIHDALSRVKDQYPELSMVDKNYVVDVLEDGDGKPSDAYLRHKKADAILHPKNETGGD